MAAVRFAAERATTVSADLEIVTCTGGHQVPDVDEEDLQVTASPHGRTRLRKLVRRNYPDLHVSSRIEDCPPEMTLVAASVDAGMVVLGTRGRGAFEGMLLGSVSHAVIHGCFMRRRGR
jgi:nucleotide-binding universal stress UspA family protein